MTKFTRLGVTMALALASGAVWTTARADASASLIDAASKLLTSAAPTDPRGDVFNPGSPPSEPVPAQAYSSAEKGEEAWVQSIWNSP